jgi:hypothetical protein
MNGVLNANEMRGLLIIAIAGRLWRASIFTPLAAKCSRGASSIARVSLSASSVSSICHPFLVVFRKASGINAASLLRLSLKESSALVKQATLISTLQLCRSFWSDAQRSSTIK